MANMRPENCRVDALLIKNRRIVTLAFDVGSVQEPALIAEHLAVPIENTDRAGSAAGFIRVEVVGALVLKILVNLLIIICA